jgi:putative DNA primase/helicase
LKSKLWDLTIPELTKLKNNPSKRFNMLPGFHDDDSKNGGNASMSGDLLHCWRHSVSHNAFTFLAVKAGLYTCNDAGRKFKGHRFGCTKSPENVFKVWSYAKENKLVPDNDPIPSKALEYAAINIYKLCTKSEIIDDWKLPTDIYNKTLACLKTSGINTGREPFNKKNVCKSCNSTPIKFKIYFDEVALRVLKTNFIFSMRDNKQLYIYRNGVYKSDGAEAILDTLIRDVHNEMFIEKWQEINSDFDLPEHIPKATTTYVNEVLAFVRAYTHELRADIDNKSGKFINLKNGMFDLDKWELVSHDPKYISIIQTPVIYDPNAECTQIEKFINEVARPEDLNFLYEWFGYCLTTDTNQQRALMVYGIPGTGKSVLLSLLETFIGRENCSAESLQKIEEDKYRAANVYGKRVNVCSDIPSTRMHKTEMFKKMVSGLDTIDAEQKYQTSFTFRNVAKLAFSANKLPEGPKDPAFFERFCLIEFIHKFRGTEEDDKHLITKLTENQELSGLLNLALLGLKRVYYNTKFSYYKTFEQNEQEYMLNSNPVAVFMEECAVISDQDIEATLLYLHYIEWSKIRNKDNVSNIEFSRKLSKIGYTSHRENETNPITGKINCSKKVTYWDNLQYKIAKKSTSGQDVGQDQKDRSCPKKSSQPIVEISHKTVLGQDLFSFVDIENDKNTCKCDNIETVKEIKREEINSQGDFLKDPVLNSPRVCFSNDGGLDKIRTGSQEISCPDPVLSEKTDKFTESLESNSVKNITTEISIEETTKVFAKSNLIVTAEEMAKAWEEEGI